MAAHNNQEWISVSYKKHKPNGENKTIQSQSNCKQTPLHVIETTLIKKPLKQQITKVEKSTGPSPNSQKANNLAQHHRKIESAADGDISSQHLQYYSPKFRARLLNLRLKLNLTRKEFAQKLNVKESVIKGIENNTEIYDPNIMSRLCNELQRLEN